jgi:hypothetical protein
MEIHDENHFLHETFMTFTKTFSIRFFFRKLNLLLIVLLSDFIQDHRGEQERTSEFYVKAYQRLLYYAVSKRSLDLPEMMMP